MKKLILYGHVLRQARTFLSLVNLFSAAFRVTYKVVVHANLRVFTRAYDVKGGGGGWGWVGNLF